MKQWTAADQQAAHKITAILGTAPSFTGAYALGVHAGIGGAGHQAIKNHVQDVMGLVAEYVAREYPGRRLHIEPSKGGGPFTYSLEVDTNPALNKQALTRAKTAETKLRRAQYEFADGTPEGRLAIAATQAVLGMVEAASVVYQAAKEAAETHTG